MEAYSPGLSTTSVRRKDLYSVVIKIPDSYFQSLNLD